MAVDQAKEAWLELFYPTLLRDVLALDSGDGTPSATVDDFRGRVPGGFRGLTIKLEYRLADRMEVVLDVSLRWCGPAPAYILGTPLDLATWQKRRYAMGYRPRLDDRIFAADLDEVSGHHVHLLSQRGGHIPARDVDPDTTDVDPREFVRLVAEYRRTKVVPLRPKASP